MSKTCPECHNEVYDEAYFCPNCGWTFIDAAEERSRHEQQIAEQKKRQDEEAERIESVKRDHRSSTANWGKYGWAIAVIFTFAVPILGELELLTLTTLTIAAVIIGFAAGFLCSDTQDHSLASHFGAIIMLMLLSLIPITITSFLDVGVQFVGGPNAGAYWGHMVLAILSIAVGGIARWAYERNFRLKNHL